MAPLAIEPAGSADTRVCECCGGRSRRVWSYAYQDKRGVAAYFVHWTLGRVIEHGANIDLIVGAWGDEAESDQRSEFRSPIGSSTGHQASWSSVRRTEDTRIVELHNG